LSENVEDVLKLPEFFMLIYKTPVSRAEEDFLVPRKVKFDEEDLPYCNQLIDKNGNLKVGVLNGKYCLTLSPNQLSILRKYRKKDTGGMTHEDWRGCEVIFMDDLHSLY